VATGRKVRSFVMPENKKGKSHMDKEQEPVTYPQIGAYAEMVWYGDAAEDHAIIITPEGTPAEVERALEEHARDKGARSTVLLRPVKARKLGEKLITVSGYVRSEALAGFNGAMLLGWLPGRGNVPRPGSAA
jgi:hypothetical protein